MSFFRYRIKMLRSAFIIIDFLIALAFIRFFRKKSPQRRIFIAHFVRYHSKQLLKILNVKFDIKGKLPKGENSFIACNHLSYIDIIALHSIFRNTCFIAAKDMLDRKGLGTIIKYGNAYGIERRNRDHIEKNIIEMQRILNNGFDILMFPEGRTSNGENVLRFKEPLFEAAIRAKKKVVPLTINYLSVNKEPISLKNKDIIFWYGSDISFLDHFKKFCKAKVIKMELVFGVGLDINNETSKSISIKARGQVAKKFTPIAA